MIIFGKNLHFLGNSPYSFTCSWLFGGHPSLFKGTYLFPWKTTQHEAEQTKNASCSLLLYLLSMLVPLTHPAAVRSLNFMRKSLIFSGKPRSACKAHKNAPWSVFGSWACARPPPSLTHSPATRSTNKAQNRKPKLVARVRAHAEQETRVFRSG